MRFLVVTTALLTCLACGDDRTEAVPLDAGTLGSEAGMDSRPMQDNACDAVVDNILLTCGNIVCHDPFSGGIGVDLELSRPDALPESLLGRRATDACDNALYIDPDDPESSLLLRKLADSPPCGERMPAGDRPPLDATERACFKAWVVEAANAQPAAEGGI